MCAAVSSARRSVLVDVLAGDEPPQTVTLVDACPAVAKELPRLPKAFHRDPADRLIVATARALDVPVLTRDTAIRGCGLVRLWRP